MEALHIRTVRNAEPRRTPLSEIQPKLWWEQRQDLRGCRKVHSRRTTSPAAPDNRPNGGERERRR